MTEATWTEKFDRWWAGQGVSPDSPANLAKGWLEAAFLAGAAAERAEHAEPQENADA